MRDNMHFRNKIHFERVQRIKQKSTYPNERPIKYLGQFFFKLEDRE